MQRKGLTVGMPRVMVKDKESIDDALRRFKRECERDGLMAELKKRGHYESPTVRKKKKKIEAIRKKKRKEIKARLKAGYIRKRR